MRDGIGGKFHNHAQRFNNAATVHLFKGVQRMDGFGRLRQPVSTGQTGIESPDLPGEQQQRRAGQKEGQPGMGDDHPAPLAPARAGARGVMLIQLGGKGHAAKINARTEQDQRRRNQSIGEQYAHCRHQKSGHADGADFADRNCQEDQESDGYRGG